MIDVAEDHFVICHPKVEIPLRNNKRERNVFIDGLFPMTGEMKGIELKNWGRIKMMTSVVGKIDEIEKYSG